ncbi:unnamed protein product [Tilletia caries]|nr:unnamed protein product [Tilletia caries]
MKLAAVLLTLCASSAHAQYFNQGWQPGQPAQLPIQQQQDHIRIQKEPQPQSGWTSSQRKPSQHSTSTSGQQQDGLTALWSRLTSKAPQPNTTFNPSIQILTHTPHLTPLWGPHLTDEQLRTRGKTVEEQLAVPRSSVVSAARGARALAEGGDAPWARARMAGGAVQGASVGSGSKKASALSFQPSSKTDDGASIRFNSIFNETVNLIFPPPTGQEFAPPSSSEDSGSLASMPEEQETEEDRELVEDVLRKSGDALRRLRFAHADYLTEPAISWHWWIWKVPIILFITPSTSPERAYDVRFWRIAANPPSKSRLLSILSDENKWKQIDIWTSAMAPGGERDFIPERLINLFSYLYVVLEKIPGPAIPVLAAVMAQPLLQLMHRRSGTRA